MTASDADAIHTLLGLPGYRVSEDTMYAAIRNAADPIRRLLAAAEVQPADRSTADPVAAFDALHDAPGGDRFDGVDADRYVAELRGQQPAPTVTPPATPTDADALLERVEALCEEVPHAFIPDGKEWEELVTWKSHIVGHTRELLALCRQQQAAIASLEHERNEARAEIERLKGETDYLDLREQEASQQCDVVVQAAVQAERERCLRIADSWSSLIAADIYRRIKIGEEVAP